STGSMLLRWFEARITGPSAGTCSLPSTRIRNQTRINGLTTAPAIRYPRSGFPRRQGRLGPGWARAGSSRGGGGSSVTAGGGGVSPPAAPPAAGPRVWSASPVVDWTWVRPASPVASPGPASSSALGACALALVASLVGGRGASRWGPPV